MEANVLAALIGSIGATTAAVITVAFSRVRPVDPTCC
jgi:hypothetical protein